METRPYRRHEKDEREQWLNSLGFEVRDNVLFKEGYDLRQFPELQWNGQKLGTPLFVHFIGRIYHNCDYYLGPFRQALPCRVDLNFAMKAQDHSFIIRKINSKGHGIDAATEGEVDRALLSGIQPGNIYYTSESLNGRIAKKLLDLGVGITVSSVNQAEIFLRNHDMEKHGLVGVLVRDNPGIGVGVDAARITAGEEHDGHPVKYGIPRQYVPEVAKTLQDSGRFDVRGLHAHLGSGWQTSDMRDITTSMDLHLQTHVQTQQALGKFLPEICFGGGIGVPYMPGQSLFDVNQYAQRLAHEIDDYIQDDELKLERAIFEFGRAIVADATVLLATINYPEDKGPNRLHFYNLFTATHDPRPFIYGSEMAVERVEGVFGDTLEHASGADGHCESTGFHYRHRDVMPVQPGDLMALVCRGAYTESMASNYQCVTKPAGVAVDEDGSIKLITKPQAQSDLMQWFTEEPLS